MSTDTREHIYSVFIPDHLTPKTPKTVYAMAGIPAAGKSTFVNEALERGDFPQNAFLLDPDRVMNALPDYQKDKVENGAEQAFKTWELPARELAYDMLEQATKRQLNMIIDMGMVRDENYQTLQNLKSDGYRLHMFHVHCAPEIALSRTAKRERHTPPAMITERYECLQELLPAYRELADEFTAYDNSALEMPFAPLK